MAGAAPPAPLPRAAESEGRTPTWHCPPLRHRPWQPSSPAGGEEPGVMERRGSAGGILGGEQAEHPICLAAPAHLGRGISCKPSWGPGTHPLGPQASGRALPLPVAGGTDQPAALGRYWLGQDSNWQLTCPIMARNQHLLGCVCARERVLPPTLVVEPISIGQWQWPGNEWPDSRSGLGPLP